jgi:pSer/pThr/pTyr-binding forkhead associated (FHA) protein
VGNQDLVLGRRPGEGGGQIDDPAVSLRHALVRLTEHGCVIYDLGSANGTSVDDVSLTGVLLQNGDIVRVGEVELQFVLEERD